jgi:hypothetical protein
VPYAIDRTTPPSTRNAAPVVALAFSLQTHTINAATSSGVMKPFKHRSGEGYAVRKPNA